jgi:NADH-quinone oxidoreductase subunit I
VRSLDENGRPIPQPAEFNIDIDICMNCGYCAEFCPFDAIIMDHDWKLADYDRSDGHIHDLDRLLKSASYYQQIRPMMYAEYNTEEEEGQDEH